MLLVFISAYDPSQPEVCKYPWISTKLIDKNGGTKRNTPVKTLGPGTLDTIDHGKVVKIIGIVIQIPEYGTAQLKLIH